MPNDRFLWSMIGNSVTGASHIRTDLPNQDAIRCYPDACHRVPAPIVLAVSDGHGNPKSFRSDWGAQKAVEIAVDATKDFLSDVTAKGLTPINDAAVDRLPIEIVRQWKKAVAAHYQESAFREDELAKAADLIGPRVRVELGDGDGFLSAYGATLLVVAITDQFLLYLQLGDGDILTVRENGEELLVESPIARDPRLLGNETTSLCMRNAQTLFRTRLQMIDNLPPALITVSSDGYSNSFETHESFEKIGSDILSTIRSDGIEAVVRQLPEWLVEASENGSGDDITLGIICRHDVNEIRAG